MKPALTIIDDFLDDPDGIRGKALAAGFEDKEYAGGLYANTGTKYQPTEIQMGLEMFFGRPIRTELSAFRLGTVDTKVHSDVHADNTVAYWASVCYLNYPLQCQGGTAFWKHKTTGWIAMPTELQLEQKGYDLKWIVSEWNNKDSWEMVAFAGAMWNRIIVYPAKYFHSRVPIEGFGTTPQDGRLVHVSFFDVK